MNVGDHLALLREFLDQRQEIIEHIENRVLNVRGKDTSRMSYGGSFEQVLDSCFLRGPDFRAASPG